MGVIGLPLLDYKNMAHLFFSFFMSFHQSMDIQEASMEVDVSKGRRDWAFSERDKVKYV